MQLTCSKCRHHWEETPESGSTVVQCPECFSIVPLSAAGAVGAGGVTRTSVPAQAPPAVADPTLHELPTMIETPGETVASPPPRRGAPDSEIPTAGARPGDDLPLFETSPADKFAPDQAPPKVRPGAITTEDGPRPAPSQQPGTKSFDMAAPKEIDLTGQTIAGYEVRRMLGAGGMGAVCLARQKSLDRDVALKILPGSLARNPEFLARFTREALSAAQLTHHNIVQVHDVGSDSDIHFISMEYVSGENLGTMIRRDGKLALDDALGFVLQAARGLKYAHDRGIIHRDIKPDNLMVNEHGIVKIADMGLAKMTGQTDIPSSETPDPGQRTHILKGASADITMKAVAMGTPAYMAPEQARDASSVDHHADQYSLGCTLYYLVAGKAPYSGSTAFEIISKHQTEPLPRLETFVRNVPAALTEIIGRMMAKNPADRYPGMQDVVRDLEAFLGVESEKGPYTPREIHMAVLEEQQKSYYAAASLKKRRASAMAFFGVTILLMVLSIVPFGNLKMAGGLLGLLVLTPLAAFIVDGASHGRYLFRRLRSVFFSMSLRGWGTAVGGALLLLAVLWALGLVGWWMGAAVLAIGLAVARQALVIRPLDRERAPALGRMQEMLKQLRLRGVGEEAIHDFVCRYGGDHWEEFFEELFGYEAMILMRGKWAAADRVKPRRKFATWRDPVARWLETVEEHRKAEREQRQLARVEANRLQAKGMDAGEAKAKAEEAATKILGQIKTQTQVFSKTKYADPLTGEKKKHRTGEATGFDRLFQVIRFAAGLAMMLPFAAHLLQNLNPQMKQLLATIQGLPLPGGALAALCTWWGLGVGAALAASAVSARRVGPSLVTAGAALILLPAVSGQLASLGGVGGITGPMVAAGFAAAGIAWSVIGKMATGRF